MGFKLHLFKRVGVSILLLVVAGALSLLWIVLTPVGFNEKLVALGYAFCHQNAGHTLTIGGRLLPLCARCTGMYLGTLVASLVLIKKGRPGAFPTRGKTILLAIFAAFFILDAVNSFAVSILKWGGLYEPNNILRLFSGLGMGLVIANLLIPLWHNTLWAECKPEAVLKTWPQLIMLILLEGFVGAFILLGGGWLYYPVAILSVFTIPILLAVVYTLLWVMILKKENTFRFWHGSVNYLGIGLISTFIQIGLFDLLRYVLTGTWSGFKF